MLENLEQLPADPILGLSAAFKEDSNPNKVDLGVGVYKDEQGRTPVMAAVKEAERRILNSEDTKSYLGQAGIETLNSGVERLLFGADHPKLASGQVQTLQSPGGCGALRVAAEVLMRARPDTLIWVSDPTWPNHEPLLGSAGVKLRSHPYYDPATHGVDFEAMMAALGQAPANDVVLFHGCCHNPCGADLSQDQWLEVTRLVVERQLLPFVDIAYLGLGDGLDEDAFGVRHLAERCPELIVASSCSKNFGLYRERVGALSFVTPSKEQSIRVRSHGATIARGIYSTPPSHGGAIVGSILDSAELTQQWTDELTEMRNRINGIRGAFAEALRASCGNDDFDFIANHRGMFSFLGLSPGQVQRLKEEFSIYAVSSSRINVAGLTPGNLTYVADAIARVL